MLVLPEYLLYPLANRWQTMPLGYYRSLVFDECEDIIGVPQTISALELANLGKTTLDIWLISACDQDLETPWQVRRLLGDRIKETASSSLVPTLVQRI